MNIQPNFTNANLLNNWKNRDNVNPMGKFIVSGTGENDDQRLEKVKSRSSEQAKLKIRELSKADDHEKVNAAVKAYTSMQASLMQRINTEQNKIKLFDKYNGEIDYYTDLLQQCGEDDGVFVEEMNHAFIGRAEIEKKLNAAQTNLDRLVTWKPFERPQDLLENPNDRKLASMYTIYMSTDDYEATRFAEAAAEFSAVTEISSDWLDISGDESMLIHQHGVTRENFIEAAQKNIEKLKARSDGLAELMKEYKKKLEEKGLIDEVDFKENYNFKVIETIRQEFLRTGKINDAERTLSLLNVMA